MMCFGMKERKRSRTNHCVIVLLDDTQLVHELQPSSSGQDLLDVVIKHLNLLETSYFGLRYLEPPRGSAQAQQQQLQQEGGAKQAPDSRERRPEQQLVWLDMKRNAIKQLRQAQPMTVYFGVKYYASDPCKLAEEITRYQFFLQCKQDILHGRLPVSYELAVELFALAVQSELGDFDPTRHHAPEYVSEFSFLAQQTAELERRVAQFHRKLAGQVPATAELNFLERAKWLDLYGCELHPIQYNEEHERDEYALGLNPGGVLVLRNRVKVAQYQWARITKTKCQGRCFLMDVIEQQQLGHLDAELKQAGGQDTARRHRFGFRLADKLAARRLRWSFEDHKSFQFLVHNSTSLGNQLAQHRNQLKFGQKFRHSIRSAMGVRNAHLMEAACNEGAMLAVEHSSSASGYHSLRHPSQHQQAAKLRSSLKQQQQQQYGARQPPAVVRMPSRRLSNRSAAAFRANMVAGGPRQQQQQHQAAGAAAFYGQDGSLAVNGSGLPPPAANGNGLPTLSAAGENSGQRQRAILLMMQQQQAQLQQSQRQHQLNQQQFNNLRSQTLRPNMSKQESGAKFKASYYEQLLMQQQQQPGLMQPDVSIVPPGRHIMRQPTIYKASSVVNGLDQLAASQQQQQLQHAGYPQQAPMTTGQQLFSGPPVSMGKYNHSRGFESPRSTKSAIAASSAIKLASKKLAKHAQSQQQQQLIYHQAGHNDHTPLLLTYQDAAAAASDLQSGNCYYPVAYNLASIQQQQQRQHLNHSNGANSANVSPRSVRSVRIGPHQRSKSTSENLHLLHQQAEQQKRHRAISSYAEHKAALLLSTVGPPVGIVPRPAVPAPATFSSIEPTSMDERKHQQQQMIKRAAIRPAAPQTGNQRRNGDCGGEDADEDVYCSRSDCSSICNPSQRPGARNKESPQGNDWNAIKRRHHEYNQGKGLFGQSQEAAGGVDLNNNNDTKLIKNIANKQATPILLTMANGLGKGDDGMSVNKTDSKCNSSKAIQLLTTQRQQLQNHNNKHPTLADQHRKQQQDQHSPSASSQESSASLNDIVQVSPDDHNSCSSNSNSASSSPKYNNPSSGIVQSALKNSTSKMIKMADSSHNSTCGSANSATSGYYGGSQNSTGSVSLDSDSNQAGAPYRTHSSSNHEDWPLDEDEPIGPNRPRLTIGRYGLKPTSNESDPIKQPPANLLAENRLRSQQQQQLQQLAFESNQNKRANIINDIDTNDTRRYIFDDDQTVSSIEDEQSRRSLQISIGKRNPNLISNAQAPSLKYVSFDV